MTQIYLMLATLFVLWFGMGFFAGRAYQSKQFIKRIEEIYSRKS